MTSSMLSGNRRPVSTRKSGMTVLGKVPKPINLPSQRLENQGNDPNVEIVPKGTLTWGSRPSSTVPNAWGTSSICSFNADGSLSSPSGTRPSTAGSDRSHEQPSIAWCPNPRPSSASGVLASGQLSALSSRPRSAETRSGTSQLSRFADISADNPVPLVSPGIPERTGVGSSKGIGFNLSTGDFPTLHPDKNSDTNSQRGHSSQGRPLSSQGRPLSSQNRPTSASGTESRQNDFSDTNTTGDKDIDNPNHATTNSWKADNPHHTHQAPPPNTDHWHRDPQQARPYPNMNIPPQYNSWHNPRFHQGPADGSWYNRAGPPGNYPIDYPSGPPRPLFYEPYPRPYLQPEQIRSHEGYYGPPRPNFYGPADREASIIEMAPPPAVHNQYPLHNPANFHGRPCVMNNEQRKPDHLNDGQGQYRVLLKQNEGPEEQKRDWGSRSQLQEPMDFDGQPRFNTVKSSGIESSKVADGLLKNPEAPVIKKNPTLLEKVEGLNNKARIFDRQFSSVEKKANADSVAKPKELNVVVEGEKKESSSYRKVGENTNSVDQRRAHVTRSADNKQKSNRHEIKNEWAKKVHESDSSVNTIVVGSKSGSLESEPADQIDDLNAQRAKMKEIALQHAKQLQQEEEEQTREQKAKALAKLEALNKRSSTETIAIQNATKKQSPNDISSGKAEKTETVIPVNKDNAEMPPFSTDISSKTEKNNVKKPSNVEAKAKKSSTQSTSSVLETNAAPVITSITIGTIEIQPNQVIKEKQGIQKETVAQDQKNNNHTKSQAQRKVARNQHASVNNKQAMWAPVKPQCKNDENKTLNESAKKAENKVMDGSRAKRSGMERYVPKPVAKEPSLRVNNSPQTTQDVEKRHNSTVASKSSVTNKQRNFNASVEHVKSQWQPKAQKLK